MTDSGISGDSSVWNFQTTWSSENASENAECSVSSIIRLGIHQKRLERPIASLTQLTASSLNSTGRQTIVRLRRVFAWHESFGSTPQGKEMHSWYLFIIGSYLSGKNYISLCLSKVPFVLRECILNSSDHAIALTAFTSQKPLWNLCLSFGCFGVRVCVRLVRDRTAHFYRGVGRGGN